ncbi:MAG: ABC transporter ATP-binding protein [Acidobacteriota bacterium]
MSWVKNNEWLKPQQSEKVRWTYLVRFLRNYLPFRTHLGIAAFFALLGAVTAVVIPVIFRRVQEAIVARDTNGLILALGTFLAISLFDIGMTLLIKRRTIRIATWLNRDLVLQYYQKILNLAVEDFMAFRRRTNLFQRIIDAMNITEQFTSILVRGGQVFIVLTVVAVVIGLLSPVVLAVLAVGSIALFAHVLVQARRLAALRQRSLAVNYPLIGKMSEVIEGLFTIKALAASVRVTSDVDQLVSEKTDAEFDEKRTEVWSDQVGGAIRTVTLVAAVSTSFALMLRGDLLIAEVLALYVLTNLLLGPVTELAIFYQLLARLSVNVKNFYQVIDLNDEVMEVRAALAARREAELAALHDGNRAHALTLHRGSEDSAAEAEAATESAAADQQREIESTSSESLITPVPFPIAISPNAPDFPRDAANQSQRLQQGHIDFRNVGFSYRDGHQVLRDIQLEIKPGEKISLIGRSGVGKTTLIRVLLGFLQPQKGQILVDGVDIGTLEDKNAYRRRFGVVSQRDFLFGTTIRENLCFGLDETLPQERLVEALEMVNLWEDIERLSKELDTQYSGDLFSGGQQQRFFIARALLRNPSIVLLDEPTSALDFESEQKVLEALDALVGDNTTITIAHRLSTVRNADQVVVLHDGQVQAIGPHDQLYSEDEYYRSLCDYNSFVA